MSELLTGILRIAALLKEKQAMGDISYCLYINNNIIGIGIAQLNILAGRGEDGI